MIGIFLKTTIFFLTCLMIRIIYLVAIDYKDDIGILILSYVFIFVALAFLVVVFLCL